jgi:hypothetical protein
MADDSIGSRFGGTFGWNAGPGIVGTTQETESGFGPSGVHSRPGSEGNMRVRFEDLSAAAYATAMGDGYVASIGLEVSGIGGDFYHRFEGSLWWRSRSACWDRRIGVGLELFDAYTLYRLEDVDLAGVGAANGQGREPVLDLAEKISPYLGMSLGYRFSERLQTSLSVSAIPYLGNGELGAWHVNTPIGLSLYPGPAGRWKPVVNLIYMRNGVDPSAVRYKLTAGLEY